MNDLLSCFFNTCLNALTHKTHTQRIVNQDENKTMFRTLRLWDESSKRLKKNPSMHGAECWAAGWAGGAGQQS